MKKFINEHATTSPFWKIELKRATKKQTLNPRIIVYFLHKLGKPAIKAAIIIAGILND